MAIILDADGNPAFIPSQGRRRATRAAAAERFKVVKDGLGGRYLVKADGTSIKLVSQRAKAKGVIAFYYPGTTDIISVRTPTRRTQKLRKVVGKYLLNPYVMGYITGFGLPKVLSEEMLVYVGTGIATAGYFSPKGSYIKKFAVGSGIGAGIHAGLKHKETIGTIAKVAARLVAAVTPKLAPLTIALAGGIWGWTAKTVATGGAAGLFGPGIINEIGGAISNAYQKTLKGALYKAYQAADAVGLLPEGADPERLYKKVRRRKGRRGR